ncbi:hypothetical protein LIER_13783 [Lithospermum erythrorhizon]|uniref:Uncharacterized protein n=1 Tax=Lithospermum erythrorhizon TaxID=34254 RepID=A0AAV3PYP4_LITER
MVERFFSIAQMHNLHASNHANSITLLSGPPSSGKTSLLFQFAFNSALETNRKVVFICNRKKFETSPPFLSQGIDPSLEIFQRIQMKYVEDAEEIKSYFAAFHLHDDYPVLVVVDNFAEFFNERACQERYNNARGRDLAMVRILALCQNAVIHAKTPCELLLSDTHHGDSPRLLYIYKRWVSSIYTIKGDGFRSFVLSKESYSAKAKAEKTSSAKYSIALQYLELKCLCDDANFQR